MPAAPNGLKWGHLHEQITERDLLITALSVLLNDAGDPIRINNTSLQSFLAANPPGSYGVRITTSPGSSELLLELKQQELT